MAFYNNGEAKTRPGVYMRITNRSNNIFAPDPAPTPTDPDDPGGSGDVEEVTFLFVSEDGVLRCSGADPVMKDGALAYTPVPTVTNDGVLAMN